MTRMERFEKIWSAQHAVPPESLLQYRWVTQEGYRLPAMAAHFRTFCETLDSLVIGPFRAYKLEGCQYYDADAVDEAIEEAGLRMPS